MNTVYLDCSTGVSGDMLLSALSHALEEWRGPGSGYGFLEKELDRLGLDGFGLKWSEKRIAGIRTRHVDVLQTREQPLRHYTDLCRIIEDSGLGGRAGERSVRALRLLGEAEAKVHGVDLEQVHFHEIGAVDTLADICGSMLLLDALEAGEVVCGPVDLGSGFVACAHGRMPVPAPACAELAKGLTTFGSDCSMERATPTGLAILRTIADDFGPLPLGTLLGVGYGSGGRSSDEQPTYVRAMVLERGCGRIADARSVIVRDDIRVIIARYREDVSWADELGCDYVVYDKSGQGGPDVRPLPNIGREAHTYFTHIVNEYDALFPLNVFLQGDPFDHIDDRGRTTVQALWEQLEDVADRRVPFKGLAWFKLKSDRLGRPHDLRKPENEGRWAGWGRDIPVGEVFERIFDAAMPREIICRAPTGNFCVTGERIRTRPKAFYEFCLRLIEADPRDEYNTGHAFERLWQHIFNGNTAWNRDRYE